MTQDMFLKIAGINGEAQDAKHRDEIEIHSWSWNMSQQSNMHSGSGGGSGKATVGDLTFFHKLDRASPNLMKYCLAGKHISEAVLISRKAGGSPLEFHKITMSDVIVSSVSLNANGDAGGMETVSLSFSKVAQEYVVQNAQGGSGGSVIASFDIKANRET
ncbi:Hcp family type VI secretion system effector [Paraherbaspirillum soli]|uniref:Hcp family type VI secretion system effector n=1 Tax=Paraherbaspirillum soli TaxID=631222 RepID=A0ABW0M7R1_9BURK